MGRRANNQLNSQNQSDTDVVQVLVGTHVHEVLCGIGKLF